MQSILAYRRIGRHVQQKIGRDPEKKAGMVPSPRTLSSRESHWEDPNTAEGIETSPAPSSLSRAATEHEAENTFGPQLDGVEARDRTTKEGKGAQVFVVGWEGSDDEMNPHNWSVSKRCRCTALVASVCFGCLISSSIDSAVAPQAAEQLGVSPVVESLATAQFLLGSAFGSLFTGPFSETFGRNPVYIGTMIMFMIWVMASGLSPNIGAQVTFRFFVGVFGCAPLTCAGGTMSDLWDPLEKVYGFALFAIVGFSGAMLGPVICSYVGTSSLSWRWADWITLILGALVTVTVFLLLPETHPSTILSWRSKQLRLATNDDRYQSQAEVISMTFWDRLRHAIIRPWTLAGEAIVIAITIYLSVIWAVLFTFLDGYTFIFTEVYGVSQGITNVIFAAMYVGVLLSAFLVPVVYKLTKRDMEKRSLGSKVRPETRWYYAMFGGGWAIPVSLFWLAWTDYASVSIWSPIIATSLFGFGLITVFLSSYLYIIDAYEVNAASALTFATVVRFIISGGLVVAGIPFYENVGTHWTLTIMGCLGLLCAPIPYVLYKYGPWVRQHSKHAVNKD